MKHNINPVVNSLEISGIRKFFNLVAGKEDIISLTIGQPDFYTPSHVKEAAISAIEQNKTTYTANAGLLSLRKAISDFVKEKYILSYQPETEIITTVGASQAIDITLRTIIVPGDEVILPAPIYPGYEPLIKLAGGVPVHIDTRETNFKITPEALLNAITEKTKCVILPYPSNPTGATFTPDELKEIAEVLKEKEIFILADEIYSELNYDFNHVSIASFPEVQDKTIVINGLSKSHSMTGWRIGYLMAPEWLASQILKVHQYNVTCASSISQYAALEALTNGINDPEEMKSEYLKRRNYVVTRLKNMGVEIIEPNGAFYLFPKLEIKGMSTFELALKLVDEARLALVPGSAFTTFGEGYVRISFAYDYETLKKGMDRLEEFLTN